MAVEALPVRPPLAPMLATLARELPRGRFLYEPKWDGFRCLAFRAGGEVFLQSRHGRALARYFPEVVRALRSLGEEHVVLDGELVVRGPAGADFDALLARIHPASSRVDRLSRDTPAQFIVFDLLARGRRDLSPAPFAERRRQLEDVVSDPPAGIELTPVTDEPELAARWLAGAEPGIDGVVAKRTDDPYRPGTRALVKVKLECTADCVIGGFRVGESDGLPSSLLLGLYDEDVLVHVGVSASFARVRRRDLVDSLAPLVVPLHGHPWQSGFLTAGSRMGRLPGAAARWVPEMSLDWVPVAPELVCEVAYDHAEHARFRHPARFRRWRPDREPRSCSIDQLLDPRSARAA